MKDATMVAVEHELLLRAIFWEGPSALTALRAWQAIAPFDALDGSAQWLLPLLYERQQSHAAADILGRCKGHYRRAWTMGKLLFHRLGETLQALDRAGVEPILMQGAALTARSYRDLGLRPMDSLDMFVSPDWRTSTIAILERVGWKAVGPASFEHWVFQGASRQVLVLHRRLAHCPHSVERDLVRACVPVHFEGSSARVLHQADQLVAICASGTGARPVDPVVRIADLLMLLRPGEPPMDWEGVVRQAIRCRATLAVRETLCYLQQRFQTPVPAFVLAALWARVGLLERALGAMRREMTARPRLTQSVLTLTQTISPLYRRLRAGSRTST